MPHEVIFVVANRDSGKTTNLIKILESRFPQAKVCGVLSLANKKKTCYRLKDLASKEERVVMDMHPIEGAANFGRFHVDQAVFDWANESILDDLEKSDVAVFDEIGRIELLGGGLAPSFKHALEISGITILTAVRTQFVPEVLSCFDLQQEDVVLYPCL